MIKEIVFATNNKHKLEELRAISGDRMRILSLADIDCHDEIPETADTLAGNALIKARWVKEKYGYDCFADDTGLMVDALGGEPGVRSARYASEDCDSERNIDLLLSRLEGVPEEKRTAHFSTVIALVTGDEETLVEGRVDGSIATSRHGSGGFGYDPVFISRETGMRFADMTPEAKNAISHRGRAAEALFAYLDGKTDENTH